MNRTYLAIAFAFWAVPAAAQQAVPLTLAEAEQRALDKNPSIASARLDAESATYGVVVSKAAYEPLFTASLAQRSQSSPSTSQLSGGQEVTTDALSVGTGMSQALRWGGGSVSVDFSGSRSTSSNTFATYNPSLSSGVTLSYTQPLFGGRAFDTTRAEIVQAEISSDIADASLRQQRVTTLASVRRAYWELVYATDALGTARQSEALAQQQLDDNRRRAELGTVAAVDIIEAEAEVAARHQAVVQAEGALRAAQVALKELLVADASDPIWQATIFPVDRPNVEARSVDVTAAIARATANRSDLEIARSQRSSAATSLRLAGEQVKPAVNLVAEYGLNGIGGNQILRQSDALGGSVIGTAAGSYLDVLRSIGTLDYPTWSVGVSISMPIGNTAAQAGLARARVEQRQVETGLQALEVAVAAQVTRAADQVRTAEEQVRAAAAARALAQKRLEAEQARRAAGLSTNFLVLQAQRDLATAQTAELRAALDYRTALVDFDLVQQSPA